MDFVGTFCEIGKKMWEAWQRGKENGGILDKKIEELSCLESDVQIVLKREKLQAGMMPKREVEFWLESVQKFKDEVHDIKQKLGEVGMLNLQGRINLVKKVEEKIKEADELKEKGRFHERLVVELLPESLFQPTKLVGETTTIRKLKEIEERLVNDKVAMIGVCGMGGVGKTTIMTHIHNKFKNDRTFESVIWVTVSRESNLNKLQDDVSKALHIEFTDADDALHRSSKLFGAFNERGKFLLILDDMWSTFPLEKIGIPKPNQENNCKIVWTTRSKKVCRGMNSERIIEVHGLSKDESWNLFNEKFGVRFVLSPEIEPIAKAVVDECDGLPLGIITVGAAMRGVDDIRIWRNALEDLKNSRPDLEGLEDDVYSCLKFSFDQLKTQPLRDCFLYCALYPEDFSIACDSIIEKWIEDGFFDDNEDREKGFDKGYTIINDLKDACMLEHGGPDLDGRSQVKMHDLLRDLAIAITRKSRQFVVKVSSKVNKFPRDENLMDDVIRVSLMNSDIGTLSCQSNCPKLSTLLLQGTRLSNIDSFFFEHMQNLRVLDLSKTQIKSLPQSLSSLVNLHALLLRQCRRLTGVHSIVHLRELRVLDLSETSIKYLPEGMGGLTNLRCLDLYCTSKLQLVPASIISNFSHLEELSMMCSGWRWSSNENENGRGAGVEEIVRLTCLKKLLVNFLDLSAWSSYVRSGHWRGLNCFILTVGDVDPFNLELDRLYNFYSRERLVYVGNITGIECMNSYVFRDGDLTEWHIIQLDSLRAMYIEEPTQVDTLANLKCIYIWDCPKLKYVFSVGWFQTLQNLEEMDVHCCQVMEEMVVDMGDMSEADNNTTITLPRLKTLTLNHLPKMKSICNGMLVCTSLTDIEVDSCPMLKKLPFSINSVSPSSLKEIRGSIRWWQSLEWDNSDTKIHFGNFFEVSYAESEVEEEDSESEEEEEEAAPRGTKRKADSSEEEEEAEPRGTKRKADSSCLVELPLPELSPTFPGAARRE